MEPSAEWLLKACKLAEEKEPKKAVSLE